MQVDSLPSGGASWRLFYTTAGGAGIAGAGKEWLSEQTQYLSQLLR